MRTLGRVVGVALVVLALLAPEAIAAPPKAGPGYVRRPPAHRSTAATDNAGRMDANNLDMFVTNHGSFAWDLSTSEPGLRYPKGTTKTALFAAGIWVGAQVNDSIRTCIAEYSQEYAPGPMLGGAFQVDQPAFKTALDFYAKLVQDAGEKDAANSSFNECLAQYQAGKVAIWYDATVAAGLLEASNSPVKGKNGYALAPVDKTKASGWLWSWALAIPESSPDPTDARKYIAWATGPSYIKAAGTHTKGGWASIPPGTRASTYAIPQYKKAAAAFAAKTLAAMKAAPISNPGTTKRPGLPGVQYVGIPQFQDVGNQCTQLFSSVIAGSTSVGSALSQCQQIASQAIK